MNATIDRLRAIKRHGIVNNWQPIKAERNMYLLLIADADRDDLVASIAESFPLTADHVRSVEDLAIFGCRVHPDASIPPGTACLVGEQGGREMRYEAAW